MKWTCKERSEINRLYNMANVRRKPEWLNEKKQEHEQAIRDWAKLKIQRDEAFAEYATYLKSRSVEEKKKEFLAVIRLMKGL